jgi:hypothetical protein
MSGLIIDNKNFAVFAHKMRAKTANIGSSSPQGGGKSGKMPARTCLKTF